MEARPEPADPTRRGPSRSPIPPAMLGPVLIGLARELEGPLAAMRAGLASLAADPDVHRQAEVRAQVGLMRELGQSLSGLSRDYFDFAAVTEGVLRPRIGPTRLAELLGPIDLRYASAAARRGIDWTCRLEAPEAVVATDPAWCRRLLGGLVSNALRFTPPGGRVVLSARGDDAGWSLVVRDTGRGLPTDILARAGVPFHREPGAGERSDGGIEGNGLGLPLVLALASRLGGRCSFDPEPNGGTCAAVRFAAKPGPASS